MRSPSPKLWLLLAASSSCWVGCGGSLSPWHPSPARYSARESMYGCVCTPAAKSKLLGGISTSQGSLVPPKLNESLYHSHQSTPPLSQYIDSARSKGSWSGQAKTWFTAVAST